MASLRMPKACRNSSRQELTLATKVELIKCKEREVKSNKQLADIYKIGKTTEQNIVKRKADYLSAFEANEAPDRKRVCARVGNEELECSLWVWFQKKTFHEHSDQWTISSVKSYRDR